MNDLTKIHKNLILIILFSLFFLIGLITFKDYGVHIEEKFHRSNGLYWLNYLLNFTEFETLKNISLQKLESIGLEDYSLSSVIHYNKYGVIFDLPVAFIEIIFNIENTQDFYHLKHFLSFFLFFFSSIVFYKIINNRYRSFNISLIGTLLYVLSPRIYGDSFFYKDILFLSLVTFSIYYVFLCLDKFSYKNLAIFSFLSAICISTRIIGIFLPVSFLIVIILSQGIRKEGKNFYIKCLFYISSLIFILILHWPYLWSSPIDNFISLFSQLKNDIVDFKILFNGDFVNNRNLPYKYIPFWIGLTSPVIHLILFCFGFSIYLKRFFFRFTSIKEKSNYDDNWRGGSERKDFFILFNIITIILFLITFNVGLYNGWRIIYFINIFLIYFATYGFYIVLFLLKKASYKFLLNISLFFLLIILITRMAEYHPYQSIYFNVLVPNKIKNSYEIDYYGLAGTRFLKKISSIKPKEKLIKIAVASHTPLQRSLEALNEMDKRTIKIVGQEYNSADYIFKNNISEINPKYNDKYDIPESFVKIEEYIVDGILLYEVYKSKEK